MNANDFLKLSGYNPEEYAMIDYDYIQSQELNIVDKVIQIENEHAKKLFPGMVILKTEYLAKARLKEEKEIPLPPPNEPTLPSPPDEPEFPTSELYIVRVKNIEFQGYVFDEALGMFVKDGCSMISPYQLEDMENDEYTALLKPKLTEVSTPVEKVKEVEVKDPVVVKPTEEVSDDVMKEEGIGMFHDPRISSENFDHLTPTKEEEKVDSIIPKSVLESKKKADKAKKEEIAKKKAEKLKNETISSENNLKTEFEVLDTIDNLVDRFRRNHFIVRELEASLEDYKNKHLTDSDFIEKVELLINS